jgi:hypothetical protein
MQAGHGAKPCKVSKSLLGRRRQRLTLCGHVKSNAFLQHPLRQPSVDQFVREGDSEEAYVTLQARFNHEICHSV